MIFNRCVAVLLGVCLPLAVSAAAQPCNLTEAERIGQGWLDLGKKSQGVLTYLVDRKQFEKPAIARPAWTVNLQARDAALKGFSDYYRKISPPTADNSVLIFKGLQAREVQCAEGIFVAYDVNVSNLAWEVQAAVPAQTKADTPLNPEASPKTQPSSGTLAPKQPLIEPLAIPKVVIED